jgi:hypothetical protein
MPTTAGVTLTHELTSGGGIIYLCFLNQHMALTHGMINWYYNGGNWRDNRNGFSTTNQQRFVIRFAEPKTVCGFSVGGIAYAGSTYTGYTANYCYANCLLIEGRASNSDYWRRIDEVEFDPAERRTCYFDFPVDRLVGQLRITVQDVTHGSSASTSASVYLPPMQVYGW